MEEKDTSSQGSQPLNTNSNSSQTPKQKKHRIRNLISRIPRETKTALKNYYIGLTIGTILGATAVGVYVCRPNKTATQTQTGLYHPAEIKRLYDKVKEPETTKIGTSEYFWMSIDPNTLEVTDPNHQGEIADFNFYPILRTKLVKTGNSLTNQTNYSSKEGLEGYVKAFVESEIPKGTTQKPGKGKVIARNFKDGKERVFANTKEYGILMIENPIVDELDDGTKIYSPQKGQKVYLLKDVKYDPNAPQTPATINPKPEFPTAG